MTTPTQPWPSWTQLPGWLLRAPRLERITEVVFALATLTGLVVLAVSGASPLNYLALAMTVGGMVMARWWRWPGITLAALGPLLSALVPSPVTESGVGSETVLIWSLVVFGAFYWALQGTLAFPLGMGLGLFSAAAFGLSGAGWLTPLVFAALASTVASAAIGSAVSSQRRFRAEAEARAADARLTREAEINRRIATERLRIARDLHDMVGHQVAVVSMHLGAAEVHLASSPDAVAADLAAARQGVQGVLKETQRILEILRESPGEDAVAPTADHTHLEALVESFRQAGSVIDADLAALPDDTAADVGAALYRAVQEALTNAQRYGTGTTRLRLRAGRGLVRLTVANRIRPGAAASGGGFGLVGMGERIAAAGGRLATSSEDGVFTVDVALRLDGRPV